MPVVPLRDFGRKPSKARPKSERELEAERRLEQALSRVRAALPLGLVNPDLKSRLGREPLWYVAESSVQQQASKAILGLAEALTEHYTVVEGDANWVKKAQEAVSSAVPALHFLLGLSNASIVQRAAQACHVAACQLDIWRDAMIPRLANPLAALIDSKDIEASFLASASLRLFILDKPSSRSKGSKLKGFRPLRSYTSQQLYNTFVETCALDRVQRQLMERRSLETREQKAGDTSTNRTALEVLELLNAALKKSPNLLLKHAVADLEWVHVLGCVMLEHDQRLVAGALAVAAVLAKDKSFGAALLRECQDLSAALLKQIESTATRDAGPLAALQLLAAIAPLRESDTPLESESIAKALVKQLLRPQADDSLLTESLSTVGALLQRRGSTWSTLLLSSGLVQGLVNLLGWPAPSDRIGEVSRHSHSGKSVLDPHARKLSWRLVELLGSCEVGGKGALWEDLPKLVWSHFYSKVYFYSPGDAGSAEERVEISRALISCLSFPPSSLSKATRAVGMQDYSSMTEMRIGILPGDPPRHFQSARTPETDCLLKGGLLKAAALALLDPFRISSATGFRVITLLALKLDSVVAAVTESEESLDAELDGPNLSDVSDLASSNGPEAAASELASLQLLGGGEFDSSETEGALKQKGAVRKGSAPRTQEQEYPAGLYAESLEEWEGKDTLLLAALQAFCGLYARWRMSIEPLAFAGSKELPNSQGALLWWEAYSKGLPITKGLFDELRQSLLSQLGGLCSSHSLPPGARCWGMRALAELGLYGCPSTIGEEVAKAVRSSDASDILFSFADGQRVAANAAILAARCPALLASTAKKGSGTETMAGDSLDEEASEKQTTIQLSSRVSHRAFVCLLEYIYTGQVILENAEVKRELLPLARKSGLECLAGLLERRRPFQGDRSPLYSLASALNTAVGMSTSDVTLLITEVALDDANALSKGNGRIPSAGPARLLAHRIILSARSEYFGALFRSGMREGITGTIHVPDTTKEAVQAALGYIYTGRLVRPHKAIDTAAGSQRVAIKHSKDASMQVKGNQRIAGSVDGEHAALGVGVMSTLSDSSLVVYVETAALARRWMLERLEELCLEQVKRHLTPENALAVLQAAAARSQWGFAEAAVSTLGPRYRDLINEEGFRGLPDELQEAVRLEHVRLQQEG